MAYYEIRDKYALFKDSDNILKALEGKLSVNNTLLEMTERKIKYLIDEIFSQPPKKNYVTNKTDVYQIDDIWS